MIIKKYKYFLLIISSIIFFGFSNIFNPKGEILTIQKFLILKVIFLMLIIVIPAIIMSFIFSLKYRESNKNDYSPNWSSSNILEFFIWFIPIIIIILIGFITLKSTNRLQPNNKINSNIKPITINVISLDWKWLFIYPKYKIASINQIVIPINTPINFKITSNSVMNSFFIPSLGSQIYSMAGMKTELNLISNKKGIYEGISSQYSGKGFYGMKFKVLTVNSKNCFLNWIKNVSKSKSFINTKDDFIKLSKPTENNSVKYYSKVNPMLFYNIINKFNNKEKNVW